MMRFHQTGCRFLLTVLTCSAALYTPAMASTVKLDARSLIAAPETSETKGSERSVLPNPSLGLSGENVEVASQSMQPAENVAAAIATLVNNIDGPMFGLSPDDRRYLSASQDFSVASTGPLNAPSVQYVIPEDPYDWRNVALPFQSAARRAHVKKLA